MSPTSDAIMPGAESEATAQLLANERATLAEDLRTAARAYIAAISGLAPLAERIADLEARLRVARHRAGLFTDPCPPARELAVEVLLGRLQALRPYIGPMSAEGTARAEEVLMT